MTDSEIFADILSESENHVSHTDDWTNIQPLVINAEAGNAFKTGLKRLETYEGTDLFQFLFIKC